MRRSRCINCNDELLTINVYTGFCVECAVKKCAAISKTLIICTIVGSILAATFFGIVYFMQLNSDGTYYGTEIGFKIYSFFVTMNKNTFIIICSVLFLLPFGIMQDVSYFPDFYSRHNSGKDVEIPVSEGSYVTNMLTYATTKDNTGIAVINMVKWALCTLFAPVIIIYMLFQIYRFKRYIALMLTNRRT